MNLNRCSRVFFDVMVIEVVTKMVLYYFHERGWASSDWGLEEH